MPSMNARKLLSAAVATGTESEKIRVQAVREQTIGFWVRVTPRSGSTLQIIGAPDDEASALTTPNGMVLHTVITTGTPGTGQTLASATGHAYVLIQALPIMWVKVVNIGGFSDAFSAWMVE